jgi:hypothetical protein
VWIATANLESVVFVEGENSEVRVFGIGLGDAGK